MSEVGHRCLGVVLGLAILMVVPVLVALRWVFSLRQTSHNDGGADA